MTSKAAKKERPSLPASPPISMLPEDMLMACMEYAGKGNYPSSLLYPKNSRNATQNYTLIAKLFQEVLLQIHWNARRCVLRILKVEILLFLFLVQMYFAGLQRKGALI